jgi:hypothetical protein
MLVPVVLFFNDSFAQISGGQKGTVCTSYNQCTDVEVGYFIYPNPAMDVLNIDLTSKEQATIILDLYDAAGKPVVGFERRVVVEGRVTEKFNISNYPAGYYFIRIKDITRETLETIKFMKS